MKKTHIKLVSEADFRNIPWIHYDTTADGIVNIAALLAWFNSMPSAPEVGEAVATLIADPMLLPAMKSPLVDWNVDVMDLPIGTELYTTPQPDRTAELECPLCQGKADNGQPEGNTSPDNVYMCKRCCSLEDAERKAAQLEADNKKLVALATDLIDALKDSIEVTNSPLLFGKYMPLIGIANAALLAEMEAKGC